MSSRLSEDLRSFGYKDWSERAKRLEARGRELTEALNGVGPLMEAAMANPLWGSLQGDWKKRALRWHEKHNATLRSVAVLNSEEPK